MVVNLGELGPSNTNSFVKLSVPVRLRSNVAYQLNMVSSVAGAGATSFSLKDTDVGFGLTPAARPANLAAGVDTNATPGDPTVGGSTDVNGRWVFAGANSTLGAYAVSGAGFDWTTHQPGSFGQQQYGPDSSRDLRYQAPVL